MKFCIKLSGVFVLKVLKRLLLLFVAPVPILSLLPLHVLLCHAHHIRHHGFHLGLILKILCIVPNLFYFPLIERNWHVMCVLSVINKFPIWQEISICPLTVLIIVKLLNFLICFRPEVRVNVMPLSNILLFSQFIFDKRLGLLLLDRLNGWIHVRFLTFKFGHNLLLVDATLTAMVYTYDSTILILNFQGFHISNVQHVFASISGHVSDGLSKNPLIVVRGYNSVKLFVEMLSLLYPLCCIVFVSEAPIPTFISIQRERTWANSSRRNCCRHYSGIDICESLGWRTWGHYPVSLLGLLAIESELRPKSWTLLFEFDLWQICLLSEGPCRDRHTCSTESVWMKISVNHWWISKVSLWLLFSVQ